MDVCVYIYILICIRKVGIRRNLANRTIVFDTNSWIMLVFVYTDWRTTLPFARKQWKVTLVFAEGRRYNARVHQLRITAIIRLCGATRSSILPNSRIMSRTPIEKYRQNVIVSTPRGIQYINLIECAAPGQMFETKFKTARACEGRPFTRQTPITVGRRNNTLLYTAKQQYTRDARPREDRESVFEKREKTMRSCRASELCTPLWFFVGYTRTEKNDWRYVGVIRPLR